MRAEEYNKRQLARGVLGWDDISRLVAHWQEAHGLEADGKAGPLTMRSLALLPFAGKPAVMPSQLAQEIVRVAANEVGHGEEVWNNSGPYVAQYAGEPWSDEDPSRLYAEWCALFVGWVVERAARNLKQPVPAWRYQVKPDGSRTPVGGARRLVRWAGEAGTFVARRGELLEQPIPGDLFSLDRGKTGSWQGHTGIVERYEPGILYTIEGNVGAFPAKVRRFTRDLGRERLEDIARL